MSDSLASELPVQQQRVRGLIPLYEKIGAPGAFAVMMMKSALLRAERAAAAGDVVAMLQSLNELRGFKE